MTSPLTLFCKTLPSLSNKPMMLTHIIKPGHHFQGQAQTLCFKGNFKGLKSKHQESHNTGGELTFMSSDSKANENEYVRPQDRRLTTNCQPISHSKSCRTRFSSHLTHHHTCYPTPSLLSAVTPYSNSIRSYCTTESVNDTADDPSSVSKADIRRYLTNHNISHQAGFTAFTVSCPICHPHKDDKCESVGETDPSSVPVKTLHINMNTGLFACYECGTQGTWDYYRHLQENSSSFDMYPETSLYDDAEQATLSNIFYSECLSLDDNRGRMAATKLLKALGLKNIPLDVLKSHNVKVSSDLASLVFPYFYPCDGKKRLVGVKFITPSRKDPSLYEETCFPKSGCNGLFGGESVTKSPNTFSIVLVSSELDVLCMAHQCPQIKCLSLPRSISTLPIQVLSSLEMFNKIILWLGNDIRSWQVSKVFAKKLGEQRCHFVSVRLEYPRPHLALVKKMNLHDILKSAESIRHKTVVSFAALLEDVLAELQNAEQVAGMKWDKFSKLNELLRGHRRGELTIFTGSTGSGKTTFLSDYSLDLCRQGMSTLWGSFEIPNRRLAKMMLQQYANKNLEDNLDEARYFADKFQSLPLYFLTFHGQEEIKNVINSMSRAVYIHDIEHIIIDNLQFMMGAESDYKFDRFSKQDYAIGQFRKFATQYNTHVTLVIHPRKEEVEALGLVSVYGGAKATQEADNVLILQASQRMKHIEVVKNRYDGSCGSMPIYFDKGSKSFTQNKPKVDKNKVRKGKTNTDKTPRDS